MAESWYVTPPSCFSCDPKAAKTDAKSSSLENLLIEHPSMSVYGPSLATNEMDGTSPKQSADTFTSAVRPTGLTRRAGQGKIFLCQSQEKRAPLRSIGSNRAIGHVSSRKSAKRSNQTQHRHLKGQHDKKLNRMTGKHTGMVGKRAK